MLRPLSIFRTIPLFLLLSAALLSPLPAQTEINPEEAIAL